ncbi:MAG TPA: AAA family ATPase [Acidimicrobiales bacterium]|nr:AAA family ATPase [Acidimicrobiales bacterium]
MARAAVRETHLSVLFFFGDHVVKVRKPEKFDFIDLSDPEHRAADCRREVELNRRLAPDVYLGVASLVLEGRELEPVVLMRRLPEDRQLGNLVRRGADIAAQVHAVVVTLADFHARAARSPVIDAAATPEALLERWRATAGDLAPFEGPMLDSGSHARVNALAERYLTRHRRVLIERIAGGAVCDGHGDLQADDVFCCDDGPRILDCLEFDDRLRHGDVLADVAFLAMDLERLGATRAAGQVVTDYEEVTATAFPQSLVHFYTAARAQVRLLVACLQAEQEGLAVSPEAPPLLDLTLRHLEAAQARLVLVGGSPGTGKTTLAGRLGSVLDAEVLSTDALRREVVGGEHRYSSAAKATVYRELLDRARTSLDAGRSVVLDATWGDAALRAGAGALATSSGADLIELLCTCPPAVAARRVGVRLARGADESEATEDVAVALAAERDPWPSACPIDTGRLPDEAVAAALAALGEVGPTIGPGDAR